MLFGGPILLKDLTPESWAREAIRLGYTAVYFPVEYTADTKQIDAYVRAANDNNLVIAETGAWSNPMAQDKSEREIALRKCIGQLQLADYIRARCCVNIAGSCSTRWDGPSAENFSERTFDRIVSVTQRIIDAVNPQNTVYSLEMMPWMYPDTPDSYLALIKAIDRPGFGVHLDPVNIISSPLLYYRNADIIKELFSKLGPSIRSIHAKDIILSDRLTVHLDECIPGRGNLDYPTLLSCINELEQSNIDTQIPLMLEHLETPQEYDEAARYIRSLLHH